MLSSSIFNTQLAILFLILPSSSFSSSFSSPPLPPSAPPLLPSPPPPSNGGPYDAGVWGQKGHYSTASLSFTGPAMAQYNEWAQAKFLQGVGCDVKPVSGAG